MLKLCLSIVSKLVSTLSKPPYVWDLRFGFSVELPLTSILMKLNFWVPTPYPFVTDNFESPKCTAIVISSVF